MVSNAIKETIANGLFTGIIIALFVFIGNLAGTFVSKEINLFLPKNKKVYLIFVLFFLTGFVFIIFLTIVISIKILFNPSIDLHFWGDIVR